MELKLNGRKFEFFDDVGITMRYDSIASQIGFKALFDSEDSDHKALFKPLSFDKIEVLHDGELLVTGRRISASFISAAVQSLATFSGYSLTGVLEDCNIPTSAYPLQFDGLSLKQITEQIIKPFGLTLQIDDSVKSAAEGTFTTIDAEPSGSVRDFIVKLAIQKSIIVSHTRGGNLLFTKAGTGKKPIADLSKAVKKTLTVNGQSMHDSITAMMEADIDAGNAGESEIKNAIVQSFRPRVVVQSSGDNNSTELVAKAARASELKSIKLTIELDSWKIDNKVIAPNNIITLTDPEIYIYKKTRFFIESVTLSGNSKEQVATIECSLPEAHTFADPINPFQ